MEAQPPEEATLGSLLCQRADLFEQGRRELPLLPQGHTQVAFPPTLGEAQALVQSREDEKRKAAARRDKHKQRPSKSKDAVFDNSFPGAVPGAEANNTAFWLATEGYFRDVAAEDLAMLCPASSDPLQDPVFAVPALGPPYDDEEEKAADVKKPKPLSNLKPKLEAVSQTEPLSPVDSGGTIGNGIQSGNTDKQRKSRRLHAKAATKEAESRGRRGGEQVALPVAGPAEVEQVPVAVETFADVDGTVDDSVTSSGQLAEYLLQAVKEQEVAMLTSQVINLVGAEIAEVASACEVELPRLERWLTAGSGDSTKSKPAADAALPAEAQVRVHEWLASQAAQLSSAKNGSAHLLDSKQAAILSIRPGALEADSLPESWSAWLQTLRAEEGPEGGATAPVWQPLEAVHPYTEMMLHRPPTTYVEKPDALGPSRDGGTATPSALTPTVSDEHSRGAHDATADTASAGPRGLPTASRLPPAVGTPSTPAAFLAAPGMAAAPSPLQTTQSHATGVGPSLRGSGLASLVTPSTPVNGPFAPTPPPQEVVERLQSHAEAGPSGTTGPPGSKLRGLAAGKRKAPSLASTLHGKGKTKPVVRPGATGIDAGRNAITAAVAAHIAAGPEEGDLESQWQQLAEAADLLALAPDDEVLAEMLALHSELLQQMVVNRGRTAALLQSVLQDLPRQREEAAQREQGIEVAKTWIAKQRAVKRIVKREKREAAQREAQKAAEAFLQISPRKAPGRIRGLSVDASGPPSAGTTPPPEAPMYDLLAERGAEDDALCAICGGGDSNKLDANEIVFCERCDVAVHQKCYNVDVIPAGEWLCWPCKRFEEAELAAGKPQAQIRPPRWEQGGGSGKPGSPNRDLVGGGRSVPCLLCPVRRGAFRQTTDCKQWVHQVCALWHPETSVCQTTACAAVEGCEEIKADRWGVECALCHRTEGAIIRCNAGHCATAFHPLCARNNGQHLATREGPTAGRAVHRAYCALHSDAQREKDIGHATAMEGPANALRKEARIREHLDRANAAAYEAHEGREAERRTLTRVRLELESLRILVQRINKREKLKRDELRTSYELHRGRMADPGWVPTLPLAPSPAAVEVHYEAEPILAPRGKRGRGGRINAAARSPSMQVDREVMMTTGEAAATNDKLPKGFMYVPANTLANSRQQPH